MKPDQDFNYLTYEIFPISGNISASIYKCENYPLCHIDENNIEKLEKIKDFQSFYYTYSKNEWDKDISPISKRQNMLLITCKDGLRDNEKGKDICTFNINMKTNKNEVKNTDFTHVFPPYKRFIRKDNEDKYLFEGKNHPIYLYIEILSGKINIEINPNNYAQKYENENKILYMIPKNIDIKISIKANENSVYSINDNYYIKNKNLKIGFNYLLNIENNEEISLFPSDIIDNLEILQKQYIYDYLIKIVPFNCDINIKTIKSEAIKNNSNIKKDEIYQDIFPISSPSLYKFNVTNNGNAQNSCLFYVLTYKLEAFCSKSEGITLGDNTSQVFYFNSKKNSLIFSFPYTDTEKDIKIYFKLSEGKYKIEIMINEEIIQKGNINSNKEIHLKSKEIMQKCKDFIYICKILFYVETENKEKDSKLEISLKSLKDSDGEGDDDDDNKTKLIIILCISGFIIFGIIAVIAYYFIKSYYKNKKLSQEVNQISFKESKKKDEETEDEEIFDGNALLD